MKDEKVKLLLQKYLEGKSTPKENAAIETWYNQRAFKNSKDPITEDLSEMKELIWKEIILKQQRPKNIFLYFRHIAAAITILFIIGGGYYYYHGMLTHPSEQFANLKYIQPGGNKAILTLANGQKISLTDAIKGELAEQSGIKITKTADGEIVYTVTNSSSNSKAKTSQFNTIETPIGGQYQINLPDGTKVWLNAASSLRYPVTFTARERLVELKGEGYFEVAHNKYKPFRVASAGQVVEVLGTHFNINSYGDEPVIRTTLLEGSVLIRNNSSHATKVIQPGQQADISAGYIKVSPADLDQAVAWKNGDFLFDGAHLEDIMRKISRWYNVEISYSGKVTDIEFGGSISRTKNISEVLTILEKTQSVHFKIEGRRILVMP
jgi:transmembrane sensor